MTQKTYLPDDHSLNDEGAAYDDALHLIGLELSMPVSQSLRLRGSTQWAYGGNVGSFAEGLFGVVYESDYKLLDRIGLSAGYDVGVSGGGDMDVDDGFIHQAQLGLIVQLNESLSLAFMGGKMMSFGGAFKADLLQLQLNWDRTSLVQ
ncbi:hypothetical protein BOW53_00895 [Solemya pervernicosa gill symbiont]|uniref:Autotransporter domain-containing protein n=2 Tax=Gammaproteobacteria incertae sedis TaxID=118884 RepID=A0A1T2LAN3_9GAMM|nr:hypothetical protein [Candidatus Reidiella endopervernicosa]OOZ42168.1 hypothetical protein BOW53_00895 [Solemya pervernicosa gill symbiont]QKQ27265.1 hypothetical protein HUE57_13960 [Candidatus Reidiella endopervernicosa]